MARIIGFFEGRGSYAVCSACLDPKEKRFFNTEQPIREDSWSPEDVDCDRCGERLLNDQSDYAIFLP